MSAPRSGPVVRFADNGTLGPPSAAVLGEWVGEDLTSAVGASARLLLFGQCLLGADRIAAEFGAAVVSGDVDRVAEWPGSYAAVVIRQGHVTVYADLAGQFPLYYSRRDGELLIGPDASGIAAAHRREPDPVSAAAHIACPGVLPLWWGRSAYAGVCRLEGGATLRAEAGRLDVAPDRLPLPVPGTSLARGAARLRTALTEGVAARCAALRVSADFSGGLDSTSIAFLAAGMTGKPVRSVIYHQPLAPAADLVDATHFAALSPLIDLSVVHGSARTLPFAGVAGAEATSMTAAAVDDEPCPRKLIRARDEARLAVAAGSGVLAHLTGEGGDAVLMAAPAYLADLARGRAARTLWQHCGEYARLRHVGTAELAARAIRLAGTSPGAALRAVAARLTAPASQRAGWAGLIAWWPPVQAADWLTAGSRRQLADLAGDPETARVVPPGAGPADLAALADLRRSGDAQRQLRAVGRTCGLAVHAPFLDTATIRAALSVPAAARADPWSYKPLLRLALDGLVPADVFGRRTKGDYSAEDYRGARQAIGDLRALLRDSRLADLGVIEPGPVLADLDRMAAGIAVPVGPMNTLLGTELWLRDSGGGEGGG